MRSTKYTYGNIYTVKERKRRERRRRRRRAQENKKKRTNVRKEKFLIMTGKERGQKGSSQGVTSVRRRPFLL